MSIPLSFLNKLLCSCILFGLIACEAERRSGKGLVLPQGSVESGKASFVDLGCIQCHSIAGATTLDIDGESEPLLLLGGKVRKVKTYGELVTSIVNPNHIISPEYLKKVPKPVNVREFVTPMPSFNDEMTVAQLIDLVTYLDAQYEKALPEYVSHHHGNYAY